MFVFINYANDLLLYRWCDYMLASGRPSCVLWLQRPDGPHARARLLHPRHRVQRLFEIGRLLLARAVLVKVVDKHFGRDLAAVPANKVGDHPFKVVNRHVGRGRRRRPSSSSVGCARGRAAKRRL